MAKKKIGILTYHYGDNFGSSLQAFSLMSFINRLGYKCEIINYKAFYPYSNYLKWRLKFVYFNFFRKFNIRRSNGFMEFEIFFLKTHKVINKNNLYSYVGKYNCIVFGSDQIWSSAHFDESYLGPLFPKSVSKLSYGASLGLNYISKANESIFMNSLNDFKFISVREEMGKKLLSKLTNKNIEVVSDPVFLIDNKKFYHLSKKAHLHYKNYVLVYLLNSDFDYKNAIRSLSKDLKIINISTFNIDGCINLNNIGPLDFLSLLFNCTHVITNSYHGACFSIKFRKPFYLFKRFAEDSKINQNSRIYELSRKYNVNISDIFILETWSINLSNINYETLEGDIKRSKRLLTSALENINAL